MGASKHNLLLSGERKIRPSGRIMVSKGKRHQAASLRLLKVEGFQITLYHLSLAKEASIFQWIAACNTAKSFVARPLYTTPQ